MPTSPTATNGWLTGIFTLRSFAWPATAIENGQLERAQDILHDQVTNPGEDDPRDFAWHVLWERATRQIAPLYGHERNVRALAMSPDGRTLASGDEVGMVRLWDLRTGSAVGVLKGHALSISRLVFSADGSLLASAADTDSHSHCEVLLWEAATGRELARIEGLDNCIAAVPVFLRNEPALRLHTSWRESVNGEWRESAIREIRTYDLSHGPSRLVLRSSWRSRDYTCLTDAGQIVTFTSAPLPEQDRWTLKDAETGQIEWAFDSARLGARVLTAFTPDGRIVAAAFGNNAVSCRESSTGRELFRYTSDSPLRRAGPQHRRPHPRRRMRVRSGRAPLARHRQAGRAVDQRSSDGRMPAFTLHFHPMEPGWRRPNGPSPAGPRR